MKKPKHQPLLDEKQLWALNIFHKSQIATEITFVTLLLAVISIRVSFVWQGFAIVCLVILMLSSVLLFAFGINLTQHGSNLRLLGEPLMTKTQSLRMWFRITWFSIPGILAVILGLAFIKAPPELSLVSLVVLILWFIVAIVVVLIKAQLLWRHFNRSRRTPARLITYSAMGFVILIVAIFVTYTTSETIAYGSTVVSDGNLELGQGEVRQPGKNGEKLITHNLVLGFVTSTSQKDAVGEIKAKGTRRYQYMYCSDGSSRYYEADKFKDPSVGFTHQSPDYCAQNSQGTMTTLADAPQPKTQYVTTPSYTPTYRAPTSTHCYSFSSYSVDCYSY